MSLDAMLQQWRETEEANQQGELQIQAINEQTKQRTQELYTPEALASLDSEVESYLLSHGFEKITKLSWLDDVFGTLRRALKKNPAYSHNAGYVFQTRKTYSRYFSLQYRYCFVKTKENLTHAQAARCLDSNGNDLFRESFCSGALGGVFLGGSALNAVTFGTDNVPSLATVFTVGSLMGIVFGITSGVILENVYTRINHKLRGVEDLTEETPYKTVEAVLHRFGKTNYNKAGITGVKNGS